MLRTQLAQGGHTRRGSNRPNGGGRPRRRRRSRRLARRALRRARGWSRGGRAAPSAASRGRRATERGSRPGGAILRTLRPHRPVGAAGAGRPRALIAGAARCALRPARAQPDARARAAAAGGQGGECAPATVVVAAAVAAAFATALTAVHECRRWREPPPRCVRAARGSWPTGIALRVLYESPTAVWPAQRRGRSCRRHSSASAARCRQSTRPLWRVSTR